MAGHAKELIRHANYGGANTAQPTSFPSSSARALVEALERLGYSADLLLSEAALQRADLTDPDARISCQSMGRLMSTAMEQRPMKNLGTHLATVTPLGAFPLLDYLVATSDTVGCAVFQLGRYVPLVGVAYLLDIRDNEDPVRVRYENPPDAFNAEYSVALALLHLREETEGQFTALFVSFSHAPDDIAEIERILCCPVHANEVWTGFAVSKGAWGLPLRRRDPILRGILEQHANAFAPGRPAANPFVLEVRRALACRLGKGDIQIQSVARSLAISGRSLQRRLTAAGVTYQEVLDSTRREMAAKYLSVSRLSVNEVAFLLGYSETAAFHRAFKRWNGVGPQAFRSQRASREHNEHAKRPES